VKIFPFGKWRCARLRKEKGQPRVKKHGIENVGALIVDGILSKVEAAVAIKEG